jgi:hypothetical protein
MMYETQTGADGKKYYRLAGTNDDWIEGDPYAFGNATSTGQASPAYNTGSGLSTGAASATTSKLPMGSSGQSSSSAVGDFGLSSPAADTASTKPTYWDYKVVSGIRYGQLENGQWVPIGSTSTGGSGGSSGSDDTALLKLQYQQQQQAIENALAERQISLQEATAAANEAYRAVQAQLAMRQMQVDMAGLGVKSVLDSMPYMAPKGTQARMDRMKAGIGTGVMPSFGKREAAKLPYNPGTLANDIANRS